jgi:hypothetical protein
VAQELQIPETQNRVKIRSPWAAALLPFVTLGIYHLVWWYRINRELRDYGRARGTDELGTSPGKSVLAITLGAFIVVPAILSVIHTFQRMQKAQRLAGVEVLNGWIGLVLYLVISPAFFGYMQVGLNNVWRAQATQSA